MYKARSIGLSVLYRSTPYTPTVQAEGTEDGTAQTATGTVAAGQAVTMNDTPLYVSSVATSPATRKTGVYYYYDGILINGRYRITNTPSRVGKTPVGENVTGWMNAGDGQNGAQTTQDAAPTNAPATLGAGSGTDIGEFVEKLTYTDSAANDSDSIDLTIDAQDSQWLWEWMPQKGATLYARLLGHDWDKAGDERATDCGLFVADDVSYADTPTTLQLGGVSKPSDSSFSETERTVTWSNTSIKRIGQTIAARYGLDFTYDAQDYEIECDEQEDTDSSYYNTLCKNYGLVLKVYARRLWVYDREAYKEKSPVRAYDRTDIIRGSLQWTTTLSGTYTGGTFAYTDPDKDCDIACTVGGGDHILAVNRRATSEQDAEIQLCAELNRANHGATTVRFSVAGEWTVCAGNTITITGYGDGPTGGKGGINGKYFVDKITHKMSKNGGFTSDLECSLVTEAFHPHEVGGDLLHNAQTATDDTAVSSQETTTAAKAASYREGIQAGDGAALDNAPFYQTFSASTPKFIKSGVYFFYDGILVNGRYRMANSAQRCGKLPVSLNMTGWVPAEYCTRRGPYG